MIGRLRLGLAGLAAGVAAASFARAEPDLNHGRFVAMGGDVEETSTACLRCHGLDGAGDISGAFPRLADQSAWYLYESLKDYATGIRPNDVMTPIARRLADREMEDVAAYYAAIEDAPYPEPPEVSAQTLQRGGAIAAVGLPERGVPACTGCHGANGVGQPPTYPYLAGQHPAYLEHQLHLWKDGRRGGDPLNVMQDIAERLTDEQIRAVALYFGSIRPAEVTPEDTPEAARAAAGDVSQARPSLGIVTGPDAR